jgi:proteasome accessory factor C
MPDNAAAQLRRLLQLIPEIADGNPHRIDDLAGRLGVDRRTMLRDLHAIADRFDDPGGFVEAVQIYLDEDTIALNTGQFHRPMRLTLSELGALELGLALLRSERPPEEHPVLERARNRLGHVLAQMPGDPLPAAVREASLGAEADAGTLASIRQAMRARRKLRARYRSSRETASSDRVIWPFAPVFASGSWYLVAHCERSEGLRIFRLDRIEELVQLDETYELPGDFSLDELVHEGKAFHGEPGEFVRIRYAPAIARWIAERERKELAPDGSLTLDHPLADTAWAVRHVLQYGPDAEVLEPPQVRDAVCERLRRISSPAITPPG